VQAWEQKTLRAIKLKISLEKTMGQSESKERDFAQGLKKKTLEARF
jgi:hypothetical protein